MNYTDAQPYASSNVRVELAHARLQCKRQSGSELKIRLLIKLSYHNRKS